MCVMTAFEVIIIICIKRCFHVGEKQNKKFRGAWALLRVGGQCVGEMEGVHFGILGEKYYLKIIGIYMISSSRALSSLLDVLCCV